MDTQKIVKQFRLSGWSEAVKERIAGGQSIKAFCEENGIGISTYYYRQRKVREAACTAMVERRGEETMLVPNGWTQLVRSEPQSKPIVSTDSLSIEVSGCHITADSNTDLELLAKICRTLRSL